MGNTAANARRTGIVPMACIAAITAVAVVGCGSTDKRIDELHTRGFIDIATVDDTLYDGIAVYYGTVDHCRIRLVFDSEDDTWSGVMAVTDGKLVTIEEPTSSSVEMNPEFGYCTSPSAG